MSTGEAQRAPRRWARRFLGVGLSLVLLILSGCGDQQPATRADGAAGTTQDGLTVPGSTLELGESATVPRTDGTGVVELTVTGIEEGSSADLEGIGYEDADSQTPYFVSYTMTLVSGDGEGVSMRDYLSAWAGDVQVGDLVVFDSFAPCQERTFPVGVTVGASVESCRTYLVETGGAAVDSVRFDNDDGYENDEGTQVVWQADPLG